MFKLKTSLIVYLIAFGVVAGFLVARFSLKADQPQTPVLFRINEIKKVRQLRLITYHFEEIIPIEKNGRIKLLIIVPAQVSGFVNLDKLRYNVSNDSLLSITIPSATIDSAVFQIENAVNYDLEKRFNINLGSGLYQEVFNELKIKLKDSKESVTQKALHMGLLEATESSAKDYLSTFLSGLNYKVEITTQ